MCEVPPGVRGRVRYDEDGQGLAELGGLFPSKEGRVSSLASAHCGQYPNSSGAASIKVGIAPFLTRIACRQLVRLDDYVLPEFLTER
jgi:hypothetical protein